MERRFSLRSRRSIICLIISAALGASLLAWMEWTPFMTWYSLRGLGRASEADRQVWVERVAGLGEPAIPGLLDCLRQEKNCDSAQAALVCMLEKWGAEDARSRNLAGRLAEGVRSFSQAGQESALAGEVAYLRLIPGESLTVDNLRLVVLALTEVMHTSDQAVPAQAFVLATELISRTRNTEAREVGRKLARAALKDLTPERRVQAIHLASRPELDLLDEVVMLLSDPAPEVRRAAILALGPVESVMNTDDLLRWLHDSDADVQRLCEKALRSRGLRDGHIRLGRLMTDDRPGTRLQAIDVLRQTADLEPERFLRHLSHDTSAAVRAAAVRAAAEQPRTSLADRLDQMAQNDPSATVRQLAQYYLSAQKSTREAELGRE